jgi:hypothetical protein
MKGLRWFWIPFALTGLPATEQLQPFLDELNARLEVPSFSTVTGTADATTEIEPVRYVVVSSEAFNIYQAQVLATSTIKRAWASTNPPAGSSWESPLLRTPWLLGFRFLVVSGQPDPPPPVGAFLTMLNEKHIQFDAPIVGRSTVIVAVRGRAIGLGADPVAATERLRAALKKIASQVIGQAAKLTRLKVTLE